MDSTALSEEWFEVSENEIESVLKMLFKFSPASLHVYNFIKENLDWNSKCEKATTKVYCNRKWQGSVIATVKGFLYGAAIFSPNKNYLSIEAAFKGNDIINWEEGPVIFYGLPLEICQHLEDSLISSGKKISQNDLIFDYHWIPAEVASAIEITCPEDMYFAKLEDIHIDTVNATWPYASEESRSMITDMIKYKDTVGLFRKKDSLPVSWVLNTFYGVGMLYTIQEYRKKGYGSAVMKKLVKILGQTGHNPTLLTLSENYSAKSIFTSMGFKNVEPFRFMKVE